ncbi:MAG: type II toxin-antitoxin system YafQ family toxin [Paludibacteraceae bacterium]|nr:type II toxin-antitoxin system YafQ family toxin [Paludibacteraceae bacterium]
MTYKVFYSSSFKRDIKRCQKRGLNLLLLQEVVDLLRTTGTLPPKYRPHRLVAKYAGYWEAHIQPDWLIVWEQNEDQLYLLFTKTGTHSDIF